MIQECSRPLSRQEAEPASAPARRRRCQAVLPRPVPLADRAAQEGQADHLPAALHQHQELPAAQEAHPLEASLQLQGHPAVRVGQVVLAVRVAPEVLVALEVLADLEDPWDPEDLEVRAGLLPPRVLPEDQADLAAHLPHREAQAVPVDLAAHLPHQEAQAAQADLAALQHREAQEVQADPAVQADLAALLPQAAAAAPMAAFGRHGRTSALARTLAERTVP